MINKKPLQVKGVAVKSLPEFIEIHYPDILGVWLRSLENDVRRLYERGVLVSRWYDADKYLRQPGLLAAKLLYMSPQNFGWESGIYSSYSALRGIYKFFLKFGGPSLLIKRVPFFLQTYYRPAQVRVLFVDDHQHVAKLEFIDFVPWNDLIIYRIMGWGYNTLLEAGAQEAEIKLENVQQETSYMMVITWA